MRELVFVDELPPAGYSHAHTETHANELKRNAGKWAVWPTLAAKAPLTKALAKFGQFEIERRTIEVDGKRRQRSFVRFVGDAPAQQDPPPQSQSSPPLRSVPSAPDPDAIATSFACPACGDVLEMNAPFGTTERRRALDHHRVLEAECDRLLRRNRTRV